jgi:hypothetical protein
MSSKAIRSRHILEAFSRFRLQNPPPREGVHPMATRKAQRTIREETTLESSKHWGSFRPATLPRHRSMREPDQRFGRVAAGSSPDATFSLPSAAPEGFYLEVSNPSAGPEATNSADGRSTGWVYRAGEAEPKAAPTSTPSGAMAKT